MLTAKGLFQEIIDDDESFRLFCSIAASGETQGGWENARIAALVAPGMRDLTPKITRHGADEDKHGRIFQALMKKRGLTPVPVPPDTDYTMLLEQRGIGLAHDKLRRDEPLTERDIVVYLAHSRVTEQRAADQMDMLVTYFGDHPELGKAIHMIDHDEANHLAYCHEELLTLAREGHGRLHPADPARVRPRRDPGLPRRQPRRDAPHGADPALAPAQGRRPRRRDPRHVRVRTRRGVAPDGRPAHARTARRPRRTRDPRPRLLSPVSPAPGAGLTSSRAA